MKTVKHALIVAVTLGALWGPPVMASGFSGSYLAARQAAADHDFQAASRYYTRALVQDPTNIGLMENAILAFVGVGDMDKALSISHRLLSLSSDNQVANILHLAEAVREDGYDAGFDALAAGAAVGPLVDGLALAWIQTGQGKMSEAIGAFDEVAASPGLQGFGLYHKALALALVGDLEGADDILSGRSGIDVPATRRGVIAHAEILSQLEQNDAAIQRIDSVFGPELDPGLADIRQRLVAGETLPLSTVRDARDGLAEVFYSVAGALSGEANDSYTLVYTRVAEYLRSDHVDSILLTAQLLENLGRYELATAAFDRIPRQDPAFMSAELGRAEALRLSGNTDAAIEALQQLSESHPDQPAVFTDLGDQLRRLERYEEAAAAYDKAIALHPAADSSQWVVYYTRGISHERLKNWEKAEADFRKALELNPGQPQVLNYLGYSFVEMQQNLDEALDMIERAVEARPNDGYITDSLGWVYYRLGRYQDAVAPMERAAALMPVDPTINDHLGDVYWAVGRRLEAEFQWNRALSFDPEEDVATRIRRKLDVGLDVVLTEEGADPISVANDG